MIIKIYRKKVTPKVTPFFPSLPPPWDFGSLPAYHTSPFSATLSGKNEPSRLPGDATDAPPLPGHDIRCHPLCPFPPLPLLFFVHRVVFLFLWLHPATYLQLAHEKARRGDHLAGLPFFLTNGVSSGVSFLSALPR